MNCEQVKESLGAYLDEALADTGRGEISQHLLGCAGCGAEHDALKRISAALRALGQTPLPAGFLARLERRRNAAAAPIYWLGSRPVAWACAAVLVGLVIAGPWRLPRPTPAPQPPRPRVNAPGSPIAVAEPTALSPVESAGAAAKNASARSLTNEELYGQLQAESDRLGLQAAPEEPASPEPFLGQRLGQPGTREQAEQYIRQFAAMRRAVDQGAGKPESVPIAGSVAQLLGQAPAEGGAALAETPLKEGYWSGDYGGDNEGTRTIEDPAAWARLWSSLSSSPPPAVDFDAFQVLAVFLGARPTGGYAVEFTQVKRSAHSLTVRYREHAPSSDGSGPQGATTPYALKLIPRTDLPVRFEKAR